MAHPTGVNGCKHILQSKYWMTARLRKALIFVEMSPLVPDTSEHFPEPFERPVYLEAGPAR